MYYFFKIKHTDKSKTLNGHLHSGTLCRALYSKQSYNVQTSMIENEGEMAVLYFQVDKKENRQTNIIKISNKTCACTMSLDKSSYNTPTLDHFAECSIYIKNHPLYEMTLYLLMLRSIVRNMLY